MAAEDWMLYDYESDEDWGYEVQDFDRIIHRTEKAILFGLKDKMFWLPKSVIAIEEEPANGRVGVVAYKGFIMLRKMPATDLEKAKNDFAPYRNFYDDDNCPF